MQSFDRIWPKLSRTLSVHNVYRWFANGLRWRHRPAQRAASSEPSQKILPTWALSQWYRDESVVGAQKSHEKEKTHEKSIVAACMQISCLKWRIYTSYQFPVPLPIRGCFTRQDPLSIMKHCIWKGTNDGGEMCKEWAEEPGSRVAENQKALCPPRKSSWPSNRSRLRPVVQRRRDNQ